MAPRPLPVVLSEVSSCTKCALHETRTNTVFSRGNPEAKLCFVGEAPGADEDAQGIPFVGRAGQLLDKMIQAMGLDPEKDVYVCNIIKCRPPGNRRPEPDEVATCIPYLHEQLAQIDPKVIVALGNTSVGTLLGTKLGITKVRGSWKLYRGKIPVMPTYHPVVPLAPEPAAVRGEAPGVGGLAGGDERARAVEARALVDYVPSPPNLGLGHGMRIVGAQRSGCSRSRSGIAGSSRAANFASRSAAANAAVARRLYASTRV